MSSRVLFTAAVLLMAATAPSFGADNHAQKTQGAVELINGTKVPQNPSLPKLNLTNKQREQIRKGVLGRNTEVEFRLKSTKVLSFGERRMLDTAKNLIVKELAVARKWSEEKAEKELEKATAA